MKRGIFFAVLAVLLLVLLPLAAVFYVTGTEAGLRMVVGQLDRVRSTKITVGDVRGTLAGGFTAAWVEVDHRRARVRVEGMRARLALAPLLWRTVRIRDGVAQNALVEVRSVPPAPRRGPPRFYPARLTVRTGDVQLARGTLVAIGGSRYEATAVTGSAVIDPSLIVLRDAAMQMPNMRVTAEAEVRAAVPMGLAGELRLTYQAPDQPQWVANASFDGDLARLPLKGAITAPLRADFSGEARDLTRGWLYTGTGQVRDVDLTVFGAGPALGRITGTLGITINRNGYAARGMLTPAGLEAGPMQVDFLGRYARRVLEIQRASAVHAPSGTRVTTRGTVGLETGGPRLALAGEWRDFRWPLVPKAAPANARAGGGEPVRSPAGSYTLAGLRPWNVTARGEVLVTGVPAFPATLQGRLETGRLAIEQTTARILSGDLAASGEVQWAPAQRWRLQGSVRNLDPAQWRRDMPGSLAMGFTAEGGPFEADADVAIGIESLRGRLRNKAASGSGRIARTGGEWSFDDVDVRIGTAHLTANGALGRTAATRNLRFSLTTEDLSLLAPDARGTITARGEMSGTSEEPLIRLVAEGRDFSYEDLQLRTLQADVDVDLRAGGRTRGRLRAQDFFNGRRTISSFEMDLDGTSTQHRARIGLKATKLDVALQAQGAFARGEWQGSISQLDVADGATLALHLSQPAALVLSSARQSLTDACLEGSEERLCIGGEASRGTWAGRLDVRNVPMRMLTAGRSPGIDYDGRIGVSAIVAGKPGEKWTGTLAAALTGAQLRHRLSNGREERFALGTGKVEATATRTAFTLGVSLDAAESGTIEAKLEADRVGADWEAFPVRGSLDLDTNSLGLVDLYVSGIDRMAGRLTTRVGVSGTLGEPRLEGELKLANGELDLYQVNLALREIQVNARFDQTSLALEGSTRAGEGTAKLRGRISWRDRQPYGDIHFEGEDLLLVNVPEARIQASPVFDFKIAARRIDVTGEVKLPYARLEPANLTNAVLPSGDEKLVGSPEAQGETQGLEINSAITVTLGERVTIDTYGLSGRLTGSITARSGSDDEISRGQGELNVAEGKYLAFGRKLDVERGRLIFSNGPLADPAIDIRAVKTFPDVTAGVNVRGSLREPRMTFFSTPSLPQSQVVSLLLAGGSLESVQGSSTPGAARNDLLAQGGAILAQQFGSRVGIEDVSIESDISNETSLVLGKYLSPRLYVSYGISLAEAINTIKMRYTIDDHWTIKTESGRESSADLVFTIFR